MSRPGQSVRERLQAQAQRKFGSPVSLIGNPIAVSAGEGKDAPPAQFTLYPESSVVIVPDPSRKPLTPPPEPNCEDLDRQVDILQEQINRNLPLPKAQALNTLLQIAVARIRFNQVTANFIKNSPEEELIEFFRDLSKENSVIDLKIFIGRIKDSIPSWRWDIYFYENLIKMIQDNYDNAILFEDIYQFSIEKVVIDKSNENVEKKIAAQFEHSDRVRTARYHSSAFYQEMREFPHGEQILQCIEPFLSPVFKAYIQYYYPEKLASMLKHKQDKVLTGIFPNNIKYLDKIRQKFKNYQKEAQDFLKLVASKQKKYENFSTVETATEALLAYEAILSQFNPTLKFKDEKARRIEFTVLYFVRQKIDGLYAAWKGAVDSLKVKPILSAPAVAKASKVEPVVAPEPVVDSTMAAAVAMVPSVPAVASMPEADSSKAAMTSVLLSSSLAAVSESLSSAIEPPKRASEEEEETKQKREVVAYAYSRRRGSSLGSTNLAVLDGIFSEDQRNTSIELGDVVSLVKALGGKLLQQEGSRIRFQLKNKMEDVFHTPSLHQSHGKDKRNDKLSKHTVRHYIRDLLKRAGITPDSVRRPDPAAVTAASSASPKAEGRDDRAAKARK